MAHHSEDGPLSDEFANMVKSEKLRDALTKLQQEALGPTGEFPEGKIAPHDEGEIKFAVGGHSGKVFIDFGKPIQSIGMTPHQAMSLAQLLIKQARAANIIGASKEPLSLEI